MKRAYEKPQIEIEEFEVEDILTLNSGVAGPSDDIGYGSISD